MPLKCETNASIMRKRRAFVLAFQFGSEDDVEISWQRKGKRALILAAKRWVKRKGVTSHAENRDGSLWSEPERYFFFENEPERYLPAANFISHGVSGLSTRHSNDLWGFRGKRGVVHEAAVNL